MKQPAPQTPRPNPKPRIHNCALSFVLFAGAVIVPTFHFGFHFVNRKIRAVFDPRMPTTRAHRHRARALFSCDERHNASLYGLFKNANLRASWAKNRGESLL